MREHDRDPVLIPELGDPGPFQSFNRDRRRHVVGHREVRFGQNEFTRLHRFFPRVRREDLLHRCLSHKVTLFPGAPRYLLLPLTGDGRVSTFNGLTSGLPPPSIC